MLSTAYIWNLLRITIFNISYIRGLFPENYFNDKSVLALEMKIKKLMSMDTESRRMIDWMEKGVYDALQKKYPKTLMFCVCETVEGPMIEEYACKSSSCKMVCTLIQLMRTLDKMSEERTILMKLLYYDDVTDFYDVWPEKFQYKTNGVTQVKKVNKTRLAEYIEMMSVERILKAKTVAAANPMPPGGIYTSSQESQNQLVVAAGQESDADDDKTTIATIVIPTEKIIIFFFVLGLFFLYAFGSGGEKEDIGLGKFEIKLA
ncbi:hypothetical protein POM88_024556 [Heracleum sosnowskyi]|uniref:HORMA domain-containing protein n=1 Tax=Heracleum sosnowskyi TaxID=360622 RepID=A0AAD8I294_9APIA|nr:hypothetical protein POM88_024556 [Heracleum sosnowskyi]